MAELDNLFSGTTQPYVFENAGDSREYDMMTGDYHDDTLATSGLVPNEVSPDLGVEPLGSIANDEVAYRQRATGNALGIIAIESAVQDEENIGSPQRLPIDAPEEADALLPFNPDGRMFGPHEAREKVREVYGLIWDKMNVADVFTPHELKHIAIMLSDASDTEARRLYGFNEPRSFSRKAGILLERLAANKLVHEFVPERLLHPEGPIPKWQSEANFASNQIAVARSEMGLSQDEAAQLIGIDKRSLYRIERGRSFPDPVQIEHFMRAWGIGNERINEVLEVYAAAREQRFATDPSSEETTSRKRQFLKELAARDIDVVKLLPAKTQILRGVAPLIIEGLSAKEIAARFDVSVQSAHRYVGAIVRALARHEGLVPPELLEPHQTIQPVEGVGRTLSKLRRASGIGIDEMKEALGGSVHRLFRFEKGESRPGRWFVERYLMQIEVSPEVAEALLAAYDKEVRRNDRRYKRDGGKQ